MTIKTADYNPFDYIKSDKEAQAFLLECYQDDDPTSFVTALGYLAKHNGMSKVAKEIGVSRSSLYKAIDGNTQPKWETMAIH